MGVGSSPTSDKSSFFYSPLGKCIAFWSAAFRLQPNPMGVGSNNTCDKNLFCTFYHGVLLEVEI